jgi:pimeloyl-ACP methyl ester carboxylesterase
MSIFYREAGRAGAPVLLLPHGYPCSSFQFRRLMPALADQWRTTSLPGCRPTSGSFIGHSWTRQCADRSASG